MGEVHPEYAGIDETSTTRCGDALVVISLSLKGSVGFSGMLKLRIDAQSVVEML